MFGAFFSIVTILLMPAALSVFWASVATAAAPVLLVSGLALLLPYSVMFFLLRAAKAMRR
jgi:hypothetical protein